MNKIYNQIIRFVICGIIATIIDFTVFGLLRLIGIHYLLAQVFAFIIATIFNYLISIKMVFNTNNKNKLIIFFILSIIGLLLTEVLLYIGIDILNIKEIFTKTIATAIVMIYSFISRKIALEGHL